MEDKDYRRLERELEKSARACFDSGWNTTVVEQEKKRMQENVADARRTGGSGGPLKPIEEKFGWYLDD